jgi:hypothetical protein
MHSTSTHLDQVKSRLSTLWIFLMLNMAFADIFSFMYPGGLQKIISGDAGGIHITPAFLLLAAVMTEIPIVMVILSRFLGGRAGRWVNVAGAAFTIVYVVGLGSLTAPYIFLALVEVICGLAIIWQAWKGLGREARLSPATA